MWKIQDIAPTRVLEQVWVHVQGVPYTVRHFLGFWAIGSLIGMTLEVDLATYRSRGIVHILVGMVNSHVLEKKTSSAGTYVGTACVVRLKEYEFIFHRETADFVPASGFVPFFWRRKGDDAEDDDGGHEKGFEGSVEFTGMLGSQTTSMEDDANQSSGGADHGKSVGTT